MRENAHAAVLRQRTGRPRILNVAREPCLHRRVARAVLVQQRDQYVDVQEPSQRSDTRILADPVDQLVGHDHPASRDRSEPVPFARWRRRPSARSGVQRLTQQLRNDPASRLALPRSQRPRRGKDVLVDIDGRMHDSLDRSTHNRAPFPRTSPRHGSPWLVILSPDAPGPRTLTGRPAPAPNRAGPVRDARRRSAGSGTSTPGCVDSADPAGAPDGRGRCCS